MGAPWMTTYSASKAQVLESVRAGARQVVCLAAGLDARSARLPVPEDVPAYEVDNADVLMFKHDVLQRADADVPRRVELPADLAPDSIAALVDAGLPMIWRPPGCPRGSRCSGTWLPS